MCISMCIYIYIYIYHWLGQRPGQEGAGAAARRPREARRGGLSNKY